MNRVCLTGRLTRNPEIKTFEANNGNICTFTLAVDLYKGNTAFLVCKSFGEKADLMVKTLKKGSLIAIEGKIDQASVQYQDGTTKVLTSILVDSFDYLEKKKEESIPELKPEELDLPDEDLPFL